MLSETRRWLDRALAATDPEPTMARIRALYGAAMIAGMQGDLPAATARVAEGQTLVEQLADPEARGLISVADGFTALVSDELDRACTRFEEAINMCDEPSVQVSAILLLGWALEFQGKIGQALIWHEKVLALSKSMGESVFRGYALWSLGVGWWQHGETDRAEQLLKDGLQVTRRVNDPRQSAACLEALAWLAGEKQHPRRAVLLMAAAEALVRTVGASTVVLPHLGGFHTECDNRTQDGLDETEFEAAVSEGGSFGFEEAITYALGRPPSSETELSRQVQ